MTSPSPSADSLIRMEGIKKIFYTDEVETHALAEIHMEIRTAPKYWSVYAEIGCLINTIRIEFLPLECGGGEVKKKSGSLSILIC